jgi:eukaryotic-like serine/threonine-protein kinase
MTSEQYRGVGSAPVPSDDTASLSSVAVGPAESGGAAVFLPSEVLAERFRVVRLLGRGGMGEIYEVEDFELGERVAVKTLRPRLAASDAALALFRSEIQLARRVTHPNVCRTFDVFRHRRRTGRRDESVVFMTMELLEGETLSSRLRSRGPLPLSRALPLAAQIAAALDAAHAAGIVHRDFKSGNVLLVDGPRGRRAVVTDFGLAGAVEEAGGISTTPCGTRPYRAPEQEQGAPVGPAADVHAYGVVLAEMLTGTADWREAERRLAPDVAAVLRRCLAERPEDRPAKAADVVRALERRVRGGGPRWRRLGRAAAAAILVLLPVAALGTWPLHRSTAALGGRPEHSGAAAIPGHRQLAMVVQPAASGSDCDECVGFRLAELLSVELLGSGVEVIQPEVLYGSFGMAVAVRPEVPPRSRAGAMRGADLVALVRVEDLGGGERRYDVEVTPAGGTLPLLRWTGRAPGGGEAELVSELAARLRWALGIAAAGPPAALRRALLGDDPPAFDLYLRGRRAMSESDLPRAAGLFAEAVSRQPAALRFRLALGEAQREAGQRDAAVETAQAARRLARGLPGELGRDAGLEAEGLLARADHDWGRSADAAIELYRHHPERTGTAVLAARMYLAAGRPEEARQLVDAVVAAVPAAAADPRQLLLRSDLLGGLGDYPGQLAAAEEAVRRAGEQQVHSIVFWGLYGQFEALRRLGRNGDATAAVERAVALAERLGRKGWLGHALRWRGVMLGETGRGDEAEAVFRQALELARETSDGTNLVWCLNNLAVRASLSGELEKAAGLYGEALVLLRRSYQQRGILLVRSNLSEIRLLQGRLDEAERESREVLAGAQALSAPRIEVLVVERLAVVALERGDLAASAHLLERAEELARGGELLMLPLVLAHRSRLELLRGEPRTARGLAEEAVETAEATGGLGPLALALLARGAVELAEGSSEAALATFTRAEQAAGAAPQRVRQAVVERHLGEVWRHLGDPAAARRHLSTALDRHRRLGAALEEAHDRRALAELSLALGDHEGAAELARAALHAYRRSGDHDGAAAAEALLAGGSDLVAAGGARGGAPR